MTIDQPAVHSDDARTSPTLTRLHDSGQTVSSSDEDIRGRMVRDRDGREIGTIEHLLIDDVERKVRLMEIASGGFLHLGERKSYIPVEAITRITDQEVFISPTAEHVAGAPPYDPDLVATPTVDYQGLYSYYGFGYDSTGFSAGYPYVIR
jgi:sporulation protein YlmC with PRC-barrel domain